MKIGILGGSFNPITNGHLQLIKVALEHFDQVWIAPSPSNQSNKNLVSDIHRIKMCQLAIQDLPRIKVSDYQIVNPKDHHYDAWFKITQLYSDDQFYFILGTDVANSICLWPHYPEILEQVRFAIVTRKGYPNLVKWEPPHLFIHADIEQISSTDWREKRENGKYIPKNVSEYIASHNIYKNE